MQCDGRLRRLCPRAIDLVKSIERERWRGRQKDGTFKATARFARLDPLRDALAFYGDFPPTPRFFGPGSL
jgi:hypothetical protein